VPKAPSSERELELSWLVREGLAAPLPGGLYDLTADGLDFMVWSIWQTLGRPGMPASELEQKADS
jgi:hypothetical protein